MLARPKNNPPSTSDGKCTLRYTRDVMINRMMSAAIIPMIILCDNFLSISINPRARNP